MEELLQEFIEWAKDCGEDVFYIFNETDEAIERFLKETGHKTKF
jgi:hypothetical protein